MFVCAGNVTATQTTTAAPGSSAAQGETTPFGGGFRASPGGAKRPPLGLGPKPGKTTIATTTTRKTTISYLTPLFVGAIVLVLALTLDVTLSVTLALH